MVVLYNRIKRGRLPISQPSPNPPSPFPRREGGENPFLWGFWSRKTAQKAPGSSFPAQQGRGQRGEVAVNPKPWTLFQHPQGMKLSIRFFCIYNRARKFTGTAGSSNAKGFSLASIATTGQFFERQLKNSS